MNYKTRFITFTILLFFVIQSTFSSGLELCNERALDVENLIKEIRTTSIDEYLTLPSKVREINNIIIRCNLDAELYGLRKGELDSLRNKGYLHAYNLARVRFENHENMNLENLLNLAEAANISSNEIKVKYKEKVETAKNRCVEADMRERLPPIRDQGVSGLCYAYVAADLVSFETGQEISALDIAWSYSDTTFAKLRNSLIPNINIQGLSIDGGRLNLALSSSKSNGFCLEENLPSRNAINNILMTIEALERMRAESSNQRESIEGEGQGYNNGFSEAFCKEFHSIRQFMTNINLNDIINSMNTISENELLKHLSDMSCNSRLYTPLLKFKTTNSLFGSPGRHRLMSKTHSILDDNKIMAIDFNDGFLYDPIRDYESLHTALIVGRRWSDETNSCELLIRNSFGTKCNYSPSFDCDSGNIWVPEGIIMGKVKNITCIK